MSGFIDWLEKLNEKDTRVRAVLRRSLAFDPGTYVQAFPYVEPFLKEDDTVWKREVHYLVAGVWATHWREDRSGPPSSIGKACALHQIESNSASTEKRLIAMLDADTGQLPHRLRQIIALLKNQTLDFGALLKGLLYWNDDRKRTQNNWARDFYQNLNKERETNNTESKEMIK